MVRIKHRYLLLNILYPESPEFMKNELAKQLPDIVCFHRPSPDDITPQLLARAIKDQISLLYGDYGVGVTSSSLNVKYLSPATSTAIVRCSRTHFRLVWAALSFMTHLPSSSKSLKPQPCVFQVVRVSGSIKKAEEEAIKRAKIFIQRVKRETKDGATATLDAIFGQPDDDSGLGAQASKKGKADGGVEDFDEEDDMDSESD